MRLVIAALLMWSVASGQVVFRVAVRDKPVGFDPHRIQPPYPFHAQFLTQIFESPLETRLDDKGIMTVVPALCGLPEISPDQKTVRLPVTPGARFADDPCFPDGKGRIVTAADVVYSFLRHADPSVKSTAFPLFVEGRFVGLEEWRAKAETQGRADYDSPPEGIRAEGEVVVLKLTERYPQLRALLTQPWAMIVPREAIGRYGSGFADHPVGTGPFRLESVDAVRVRMVKNPGYRIPGLPRVDELRFEIVPKPEVQATRYLAGDLDIVEVLAANEKQFVDPNYQLVAAHKVRGHHVVASAPLQVSYVCFNMASPLLSKKEVRQAFTLALDRDKILKAGFMGETIRADQPLPPCFPEANLIVAEPWKLAKRDVAQAKSLMAAAGYPDGKGFPELIFDTPSNEVDARVEKAADLMVSQLADIGVKCKRRTEPFSQFYERVGKGDFHMLWTAWFADYPDAENFLCLFRSDKAGNGAWESNYGHYGDPKCDSLYLDMASRMPGRERTATVTDLIRRIRDDCPWIPLAFMRTPFMVAAKGVDGYNVSVLNYSLRDVVKK